MPREPNVLAFCLAHLALKSPDLALLVERWDALPEPLRAGIVAMVRAAGPVPRIDPIGPATSRGPDVTGV
jgi:hypothetical protein